MVVKNGGYIVFFIVIFFLILKVDDFDKIKFNLFIDFKVF